MRDEEILIGSLLEDSWLTLEQLAAACTAEPAWLQRHIDEGLIPQAESVAGVWCFPVPLFCVRDACASWSATSMPSRNSPRWSRTCSRNSTSCVQEALPDGWVEPRCPRWSGSSTPG